MFGRACLQIVEEHHQTPKLPRLIEEAPLWSTWVWGAKDTQHRAGFRRTVLGCFLFTAWTVMRVKPAETRSAKKSALWGPGGLITTAANTIIGILELVVSNLWRSNITHTARWKKVCFTNSLNDQILAPGAVPKLPPVEEWVQMEELCKEPLTPWPLFATHFSCCLTHFSIPTSWSACFQFMRSMLKRAAEATTIMKMFRRPKVMWPWNFMLLTSGFLRSWSCQQSSLL